MATGSRNDLAAFTSLIKEFDEWYDFENIQAALADVGFDGQANRNSVSNGLSPLLTVINPRRSQSLKAIKKHGDEIDIHTTHLSGFPRSSCPSTVLRLEASRAVLVNEIADRVRRILYEIADEKGWR